MKIGDIINIEELKQGRDIFPSEIIKFLHAHGQKFFTWGVPRNSYVKVTQSAFRFTVSGHNHKGHVYIYLNGMDMFDIYLTSNRGTIKDIIEDIGIENLFDVLDRKIERIAAYKW